MMEQGPKGKRMGESEAGRELDYGLTYGILAAIPAPLVVPGLGAVQKKLKPLGNLSTKRVGKKSDPKRKNNPKKVNNLEKMNNPENVNIPDNVLSFNMVYPTVAPQTLA